MFASLLKSNAKCKRLRMLGLVENLLTCVEILATIRHRMIKMSAQNILRLGRERTGFIKYTFCCNGEKSVFSQFFTNPFDTFGAPTLWWDTCAV